MRMRLSTKSKKKRGFHMSGISWPISVIMRKYIRFHTMKQNRRRDGMHTRGSESMLRRYGLNRRDSIISRRGKKRRRRVRRSQRMRRNPSHLVEAKSNRMLARRPMDKIKLLRKRRNLKRLERNLCARWMVLMMKMI